MIKKRDEKTTNFAQKMILPGVVCIIFGVFGIISYILNFSEFLSNKSISSEYFIVIVPFLIVVIIGVSSIVFGISLRKQREWARRMLVKALTGIYIVSLFAIVSIIINIVYILIENPSLVIFILKFGFLLLLMLFLLFSYFSTYKYLTSPRVRKETGAELTPEEEQKLESFNKEKSPGGDTDNDEGIALEEIIDDKEKFNEYISNLSKMEIDKLILNINKDSYPDQHEMLINKIREMENG